MSLSEWDRLEAILGIPMRLGAKATLVECDRRRGRFAKMVVAAPVQAGILNGMPLCQITRSGSSGEIVVHGPSPRGGVGALHQHDGSRRRFSPEPGHPDATRLA